MGKERLDALLVKRGLIASRERAKACIMAGKVLVDGQRVDKAGSMFSDEVTIVLRGTDLGYVSRGGLKLAKALTHFGIDLTGRTVIDIGASTGGFTDCALQRGAALVYAVDVGYGQLAWSLRTDPRVVNMERTNIRELVPEQIAQQPDFATVDVAFISLDKVLPVMIKLLSPAGEAVALIKPQFEAGREKVGKKGVVKDPAVHFEVLCRIITLARNLGFCPVDVTYSPIKGPEGNIEYLLYLKRDICGENGIDEIAAEKVVRDAQLSLNSPSGGN
jgi:23S rRNA (cytidine1920-2'-O)/16S rRNA (cytidine1409-2'-O)-methyltransferase